jgi:response regulator RpfG family c-di-GMP phosphodiesterase
MNKNGTIIYIDDEEINVKIFKIRMSKKFAVLTGLNASEGLKLLEEHDDVKVVLSDLKMPGMNGIEFINVASKKYNDLNFFLVTGYGKTPEIKAMLDANNKTKYFGKPLDMQEIEQAISTLFED